MSTTVQDTDQITTGFVSVPSAEVALSLARYVPFLTYKLSQQYVNINLNLVVMTITEVSSRSSWRHA